MKKRLPIEIELLLRGIMIVVPLFMLRGMMRKPFGKSIAHLPPVLELGILVGFLMITLSVVIFISKLRKERNRKRQRS